MQEFGEDGEAFQGRWRVRLWKGGKWETGLRSGCYAGSKPQSLVVRISLRLLHLLRSAPYQEVAQNQVDPFSYSREDEKFSLLHGSMAAALILALDTTYAELACMFQLK